MSAGPWQLVGGSVQGPGKPSNQDAFDAGGSGGSGSPVILAVADGHGSAAHPRSAVGARIAVRQFVRLVGELMDTARSVELPEATLLRRLMSSAQHDLPRRLAAEWRREVLDHWQRQPGEAAGPEERLLLYGTTLLGAVLTPQLFAAWQLGDGELTVVDDDGSVSQPLAPERARLGDETESLGEAHAWRSVRVHWAPIVAPGRGPRLVALSTDGLSKSFAEPDGITRFVGGLDEHLREQGLEQVRAVLSGWLGEAARHSGDDATLAAAWRNPLGTEQPGRPDESVLEESG
ncbi:protein phosphatase 2C domain-containing protein [Streptacidiphilus carbonis]|uniref:protein phosphatase 2C domain-containing protein n=1 Tax=Streptacidiphilus carbonis TaxID=105422 RepID=UPI000AD5C04A|nr:protein phosphatase 2C domain-containing protein [Streptacidiphilus carbonis]